MIYIIHYTVHVPLNIFNQNCI